MVRIRVGVAGGIRMPLRTHLPRMSRGAVSWARCALVSILHRVRVVSGRREQSPLVCLKAEALVQGKLARQRHNVSASVPATSPTFMPWYRPLRRAQHELLERDPSQPLGTSRSRLYTRRRHRNFPIPPHKPPPVTRLRGGGKIPLPKRHPRTLQNPLCLSKVCLRQVMLHLPLQIRPIPTHWNIILLHTLSNKKMIIIRRPIQLMHNSHRIAI